MSVFTTAPALADRAAQLLGGVGSGAPGAPGQGTVDVADQPFRAGLIPEHPVPEDLVP